ncbi:TetR/AcrR family transcriptional regulator [Polycladidibacter hongkongensis]|uniref:TetR/AcrR family transcriptional regulator n=1 Tax=Polycladidibacter hongkongensis TaxID=1647556 RepID=UPI0008348258|nr:TetR/AcrR family transcriptional regulator [Pseudovibrio hongkongensis]
MSLEEALTARGRAADVLVAARETFLSSGYGKSSVALIAENSGISMAHIYNFYRNKLELGCAVVAAEMAKHLARLENTVDPNASPSMRFQALMMAEFEDSYDLLSDNPGLVSCFEVIIAKRPELISTHLRALRSPLKAILHSGVMAEEFDIVPIDRTARALQDATVKFRFPQLQGYHDRQKLKDECKAVLQLLLKGIEYR